MMRLQLLLPLLFLLTTTVQCKIYDRCELARELAPKVDTPVAIWVCIAQHESNFDTSAIGRLNGDGSADHGLFQISDKYWCDGGVCDLPCSSLRDEDIGNDIECAHRIHKEHTGLSGQGFNAWTVYRLYCDGDVSRYTEGCFDGIKTTNQTINHLRFDYKTTKRPFSTLFDIDKLLPITPKTTTTTRKPIIATAAAPRLTTTTKRTTPIVKYVTKTPFITTTAASTKRTTPVVKYVSKIPIITTTTAPRITTKRTTPSVKITTKKIFIATTAPKLITTTKRTTSTLKNTTKKPFISTTIPPRLTTTTRINNPKKFVTTVTPKLRATTSYITTTAKKNISTTKAPTRYIHVQIFPRPVYKSTVKSVTKF